MRIFGFKLTLLAVILKWISVSWYNLSPKFSVQFLGVLGEGTPTQEAWSEKGGEGGMMLGLSINRRDRGKRGGVGAIVSKSNILSYIINIPLMHIKMIYL